MNVFDKLRGVAATPPVGEYAITKAVEEQRYTMGPLYVPHARDADNEFATAEELQKACWNYFRSGYRGIRDTHTDVEIGELVELISWPYEQEVEAKTGSGEVFKYKLPAGTVYAGVVWGEPAWTLVKTGKLRGYSLGGKAVRLRDDAPDDAMPRMRDLLASSAVKLSKDAPVPMEDGDEVAESLPDLTLGKTGVITKTYADETTGAVIHDVDWDDGTKTLGARQFSLRKFTHKGPHRDLENKPGKTNWVEQAGGLPPYIKFIAESLRVHHPEGEAISLAVGIVKRWCKGAGNVTAKTRAKACKAVAEWEKKAGAHKMAPPSDAAILAAEYELPAEVLAKCLDDSDETLMGCSGGCSTCGGALTTTGA